MNKNNNLFNSNYLVQTFQNISEVGGRLNAMIKFALRTDIGPLNFSSKFNSYFRTVLKAG